MTRPDAAPAALLEASGITVEYPGVRALDRVRLVLRPGEIHALMGENGAGKSTLIKVLSGQRRPDAGTLTVRGIPAGFGTPADAERAGISTVFQELDLIPTLSVADNICLGRFPTRWGLIDRRAADRRAEAALARLGVRLDITSPLGTLPLPTQQLVALSRALDVEARVLILDEPTSSLDQTETARLFGVLRALRDDGLGIVFVSHFLAQVESLADRITVLRNGGLVGEWPRSELSRPQLIEAMTGRTIGGDQPAGPTVPAAGRPVLEFDRLGARRRLEPVSGSARAGEALGIAGLRGSGRTELARLLFGADSPDNGTVRIDGVAVRTGSVAESIRHGLAFTPEDRQGQGLILDLSVTENIILALQARQGALRPVPATEQRRVTEHYIASLGIKVPDPGAPVRTLSGGNQQKVLLARWLATQPRILILDEPTRGIDVGARADIESLIADLRAKGLSIILISEELDELIRTCSRALVLRDRRAVGELAGTALTESAVLGLIASAGHAGEPV